MSTSKHIDKLCVAAVVLALLLTFLFANGEALGLQSASKTMGYESKLFDTQRVHTIDIVMDDWDGFLTSCEDEEYTVCSVVIDNEAYKNVGLRAKGNTSLSSVSQLGSQRYSFKIEFDHYDDSKSYYGLDKLSLNNLIQDNTMMKDYLSYQLMGAFGVDAPLCSFVYITVNGEDWGLYLAVEGVEDAFLQRNYGGEAGDLYKPDSMSMGGGGPGNGKNFDMDDFSDQFGDQNQDLSEIAEQIQSALPEDFDPMTWMAENGGAPDSDAISELLNDAGLDDLAEQISQMDFGGMGGQGGGGFDGGMGSDDAKLQYIDDDPDSYSTIFSSAKTTVTDADQARLIAALKALGEGDVDSCLDVDEVLRYFVVHNYVVNGDSYTGSMIHNYYLHEGDGLLSMIPWDYNLAFGGFQSSSATDTVNDPIDSPLSVTGDGSRPMVDWIFQSEEYTELYHQYFQEFLDTVDIQGIISQAAALIDPYVEKDPTKFCTYEEFQQGVETLKTFCQLRSQSVAGQLDGSVPSTDQGQQADSAALIDASAITISDMGSMNSTMGGMGGGGMGGGMAEPSGGFGGQGFHDKGGRQMQQMQWSEDGQASDGSDAPAAEAPDMPTQDGEAAELPTAPSGETDSAGQPQTAADTGAGAQMPQGADAQPQPPETGGGGDAQPGGQAAQQAQGEEADGGQPSQSDSGETTDGTQQQTPGGGQRPSGQGQPEGQPGAEGQGQAQGAGETALWLGASVLVLVLGLAVAIKFKR